MNKILALSTVVASLLIGSAAHAAVTVKYYNKDSAAYEWDAVCSGSKYKVKFSASTTGATTIQGSGPCTVKTPKGDVQLKAGDKIEIKDQKITVK